MFSNIRYYLAVSFIFFCWCCTSEKKETPETDTNQTAKTPPKPDLIIAQQQYLLKPGKVGIFRIGMPSDSLKLMVPKENLHKIQWDLEGQKSFAYEIRNKQTANQLLMTVEESCTNVCSIFRIRINNPKFQTADSIRVGSTFGELQRKYSLSFIGIGEADFVAVSENNRMTFTLDISGFPPKPLYKIKAVDIPENTPVTGILLY